MREIKFRGKRVDNGKWAYGDLIHCTSGKTYIFPSGDYANESDKVNQEGCLMMFTFEVVPETVEQFTGLKDKNDKEIYEGDIVRYTFDNPDSVFATENGLKIRTDKIFWQEWRASYAIGCKMANNDLFKYVRNGNRVEVIGNIYENPELLEMEVEE